jgi:hypothetical protein
LDRGQLSLRVAPAVAGATITKPTFSDRRLASAGDALPCALVLSPWPTAGHVIGSAAVHDDLLDADGFPDWDYMPGEDGQPFELKASDWGRLNGRTIRPRRTTAPKELVELRRTVRGE